MLVSLGSIIKTGDPNNSISGSEVSESVTPDRVTFHVFVISKLKLILSPAHIIPSPVTSTTLEIDLISLIHGIASTI